MKTFQEKELLKLSKADLYAIARELEIPGRSALSKQELIDAIVAEQRTNSKKAERTSEAAKTTSAKRTAPRSPTTEAAVCESMPKRGPRHLRRPPPLEAVFSVPAPSPVTDHVPDTNCLDGRVSGHEHVGKLPAAYGDNRLVLQTRDPWWAHAYWETGPQRRRELQHLLGLERYQRSQVILRVYDVTDIDFNGSNAHRFIDIPVYEETGSWYLHLNRPNGAFLADLGLVSPDGRFHLIVRSNTIRTPRATPSEITDPDWETSSEEFRRMYKASGGHRIGGGSSQGMSSHYLPPSSSGSETR